MSLLVVNTITADKTVVVLIKILVLAILYTIIIRTFMYLSKKFIKNGKDKTKRNDT